MRTIQKLAIISFLMILPVTIIGQDKNKSTQTAKFSTSIDCQTCVNKIMTNLPHEKGIKDVNCDLKTKEVMVTYQKEKNSPEEIKKSLEKLGFKAKQIDVSEEMQKSASGPPSKQL